MNYKKEFTQLLKNAGVPTTEDELNIKWDGILKDKGFEINNTSPFSPFWRLQSVLVAKPALQLVDTLINQIMPSSFVLLAENDALDLKGQSRNCIRKKATSAVGNITFTRTEINNELTIKSGTIIQSTPVNGTVYQLKTLFETSFRIGESQIIVMCEALESGSEYNLTDGYYNTLLIPIEGVTISNSNDWLINAGQEVENDDDYRIRQRDKFSELGDYHVDAVYRGIISAFAGIKSNNVIFEHTAPRGPGSANAYVFLDVGQVSQSVIDEINNNIASGNHGHGDDLVVFAIPTKGQVIHLKYWQHSNTVDVGDDIEEFIRAAFRENKAYKPTLCYPNSTFSFSVLAGELHIQFPELKTLTFNNIDINTGGWLPTLDKVNMVPNA